MRMNYITGNGDDLCRKGNASRKSLKSEEKETFESEIYLFNLDFLNPPSKVHKKKKHFNQGLVLAFLERFVLNK
jgi:hypothetical protein